VPDLSGSWLQTANNNMEKFMGAMGVPWAMRKIGASGGFGLGKDRHIIAHTERNTLSVHSKGLVDFVNVIKVD